MAGSLFSNISRRPLSNACTLTRSWMGIFEVRPQDSQQISIQTSRSLWFAFTRNFPVGRCRADLHATQQLLPILIAGCVSVGEQQVLDGFGDGGFEVQ